MQSNQEFLSCDWGTTAFRLRWVAGPDRAVIREMRAQAGSKLLYEQALALGGQSESNRDRVYSGYLRDRLREWEGAASGPVPLVISGMASSTVGWKELPYAKVPLDLSGRELRFSILEWNKPGWIGHTFLLSGIATQSDIIRGEEIEAIGLLSAPELISWRDDCLLVLPGTHSKHLVIRDQAIVDFRTYMTGELFSVLASHSLLKATTDPAAVNQAFTPAARESFTEGVRWAHEHGLGGSLFRTRTRAVLDGRSASDNTWFLSGVLIGAELRDVAADGKRVLLAGQGILGDLYGTAFQTLMRGAGKMTRLEPSLMERAALLGHSLFLQNLGA